MKSIVLSLGGSLIVPDRIDIGFLKRFRALILDHVKKGTRFFIITGGGRTAREYQKAAREVAGLGKEDLDWVGIHATRLNAAFVRMLFKDVAFKHIMGDPAKKLALGKKDMVVVGAGWAPGWSTDWDAVRVCKTYGVKTLINLSNIDYAYDREPSNAGAKRLTQVSWSDFRKVVGDTWTPGMSAPFDPIASKQAQRARLRVIITNGRQLENLERHIMGLPAEGTVVE